MRKGLMLALLLVMALAASACGSNKDSGTDTAGSSAEKTYTFATDASYAPMESMDGDKIVGFDVDFLEAVMKEAGLSYKLEHTGWDAMLELVSKGKEYDAGISSVSITDDRKETYDFSVPYFESTNMIMVKEDSGIQSALDLKDKKVAVQGSTTADTLMTEIMGKDNGSLKRFESNVLAMMELDNNGVDAVVADIAIVREYIKNNPDKSYVGIVDTTNFDSEYYGILLPKGSELKAKLDPAIKAMIENGTYEEIYKKWFGEEPNKEHLLQAE